jgi:hypothetical protein
MQMLSAATRGLEELRSFRARVAYDFGARRGVTFEDLDFINSHLDAIENRIVETTTNDPRRIANDEKNEKAEVA